MARVAGQPAAVATASPIRVHIRTHHMYHLHVRVHRADDGHPQELGCQDEESADAVHGGVQHVRPLSPKRVSDQRLVKNQDNRAQHETNHK